MNLLISKPAPTFDHPLEMLRACHERILQQCNTLEKLPDYLITHGNDDAAQQAAHAVLRYFNTAGQHHHADEECDLFPTLLAQSNKLHALINELTQAHREMERAWQTLSPKLVTITKHSGNLNEEDVHDFIAAYRAHIELENTQLLPQAEKILNATQLAQLGSNMAQRRKQK